jgi:hypothetical protein
MKTQMFSPKLVIYFYLILSGAEILIHGSKSENYFDVMLGLSAFVIILLFRRNFDR